MYGTAPAGIQAFGPTPYINPRNSQQYLSQYEALLQKAMGPMFKQQQLQLGASDAARGITNSGAAGYLQGNLQGQQGSALATAYEPMVGQAMSNTQSDIMANAAAYNQDRYSNYNAYNSYLNNLFQQGSGQQSTMLGSLLGSYGPNSAITGMMGQGMQSQDYAYSSTYAAQEQAQAAALAAAFGAAGSAAGGGAFASGGGYTGGGGGAPYGGA